MAATFPLLASGVIVDVIHLKSTTIEISTNNVGNIYVER